MKLGLKNIGKIESAEIELNGITVLAGENNTGKSTVGKILFCIFNSFYQIEKQVKQERQHTIFRVLLNYSLENFNRKFKFRSETSDIAKHIANEREMFLADRDLIIEELKAFYLSAFQEKAADLDEDFFERVSRKVYDLLSITDEEIQVAILRKRLEAEFGMKVGHINSPDQETGVCLNIKNNKIQFSIKGNEYVSITNRMNLVKEVIYIDDPFVLDDLNNGYQFISDEFEHRGQLLKMLSNRKSSKEFGTLDELIVNKKLNRILELMSDVCDGELINSNHGQSFVYKTDRFNDVLEISNISTGMKNFIILKTLLQNGNIDENGVIILDEPEIHLHPEWQLKFAELIVLIQKEFDMNILLNTHSPYFLNAIQVYSDKYKISDQCRYYLTVEHNKKVQIEDVTNFIERIYEKLARPLQELENQEYRNGYSN